MNFYTSIDEMPIYNWNKILEKSEYKHVSKNGKIKSEEKAKEAFQLLYNEYLDTFGINVYLSDLVELQKEIAVYKIEIALGERHKTAMMHLAEFKLKQKLERKQGNAFEAKIHVEKWLGFRLNEKEVTVKEYYNYLKVLENGR